MSTLSTTNLKNASSGSNNVVLNADGTTTIASPSNIIKSGTSVASTSGTSIDFTGIPSWVKRVTVMFNSISTNGTSGILFQVGTSSGIVATGYNASCGQISNGNLFQSTAGIPLRHAVATYDSSGQLVWNLMGGNTWIASYASGSNSTVGSCAGGGSVTLSGTLDRVRITTANGTDTFDAGSLNILYEG